MAVQKEILKDTPWVAEQVGTKVYDEDGVLIDGDAKNLLGGRGTLALGVPGNIYDATPARITTTVLEAAAEIGSLVANKGIIVNTREYANLGVAGDPLKPTLNLPAGTAVSVCSFGHVVVRGDQALAITASDSGVKARIIVGGALPAKGSDNDTVYAEKLAKLIRVVEIDGFGD